MEDFPKLTLSGFPVMNNTPKTIWLKLKRLDLDLSETDPPEVISVQVLDEDKVPTLNLTIRNELCLHNADLVLRIRNERGALVPMNGRVAQMGSSQDRPLTLEVLNRFQSVKPADNTLELNQYAESVKNKLIDIQDRVSSLESNMSDMHGKRKDKVTQEISKLENTVNFIKKRIEDSDPIEWRGMFIKHPLW